MNLSGQTLGQYRLIEPIGAGGMATVYKAYQAGLDRYVAIKILPAQYALAPGFKERFFHEAKAVAQLSHPNILPVYDVGIEEDISYFVMKYVPGRTLQDVIVKQPLSLAQIYRYINQAAAALDHAHERGIIHRDIKPSNMLLEEDWLLLADFGLAKIVQSSAGLTGTGAIMGTPAYMSPEQANGDSIDHRTDIYSLGIVLYEMVTGQVPYQGETPIGVIFKHIHEPLPLPRHLKPDLPEAVERVVLKALAKDPADRYERAGALAEALNRAVETVSGKIGAQAMPVETATPDLEATLLHQTGQVALPQKTLPDDAQLKPTLQVSRRSSAGLWAGGGVIALLLVSLLLFFAFRSTPEAPTATPPVEATTVGSGGTAGTATAGPGTDTPSPENTRAAEPMSLQSSETAAGTETVEPIPAETEVVEESLPAVPVSLLTSLSGDAWTISLSLADPAVKEIFYKFDDAPDFESTGHAPTTNPLTGLPAANPFFVVSNLAPGEHAVTVKYVDLGDQEKGPFELTFDTTTELIKSARYILEVVMPTSWVDFRDFDGKLLVYFTPLLSYRNALQAIHYSLDNPSLDQTFPFEPWLETTTPTFDENQQIYIEVPGNTKSVYVKLVYLDGTESEVHQFDRVE